MVLPILYHAHHSLHMEDLPFWMGLARRLGSPILELGCGTGRLTALLAGAGYTVFGLDRDPSWLAFLRARGQPGPEPPPGSVTDSLSTSIPHGVDAPHVFAAQHVFAAPHVFAGDMSAFHLAARFALIFVPCNTFSTLTDAAQRATLECAWRHLAPGGVFAASLPNPVLIKTLPRKGESEIEEELIHPLTGDPVQVSSAWERTGDHFLLWWHYDQLLPDGRVNRLTIETRHLLSTISDYERNLAAAGLDIVETYGDYDGAPYSRGSPFWIVVARNL